MSNKNLLNENTVRRFMKLAEIEPLTDQFVGKLNESDVNEGEDRKAKDDEVKEGRMKDDEVKEGRMKDDEVKEGRMKDDDKKMDEAMHGEKDDKKMDETMHGVGDDKKEDDGALEEEINALIAELDMADDEEGDEDLDDAAALDAEEDEPPVMDEPMDDAPAMGDLDLDALGDMIETAVMNALENLVDSGKLSVDVDKETESVDVDPKADMMGEPPIMEEDEAMVNEVARRVMKRIVNARK